MCAQTAIPSPPQEFLPWFKCKLLDALWTLVLAYCVKRFTFLQPYLERIGWL